MTIDPVNILGLRNYIDKNTTRPVIHRSTDETVC